MRQHPNVAIEEHLNKYDLDLAILAGGQYSAAVHPDANYAAYCSEFNDCMLEYV